MCLRDWEQQPFRAAHWYLIISPSMFVSMGLRHLVITNEDSEVVGILTRKDFQKAEVDHSWNAGRALDIPEPENRTRFNSSAQSHASRSYPPRDDFFPVNGESSGRSKDDFAEGSTLEERHFPHSLA